MFYFVDPIHMKNYKLSDQIFFSWLDDDCFGDKERKITNLHRRDSDRQWWYTGQ